MKLKDLISTISYNSEDFLDHTLISLLHDQVIDYFLYVPHKGEYDSLSGLWDKDHVHLILQPSGVVKTDELEKLFFEYVPDNDKPLRTRFFVSSGKSSDITNWMNWLLYNLHDQKFLYSKGLQRQFHYDLSDVRSNVDEDFLRDLYLRCKEKFAENYLIFDMWQRGVPWQTALLSGKITPANMAYAREIYRLPQSAAQSYDAGLKYGTVMDGSLII